NAIREGEAQSGSSDSEVSASLSWFECSGGCKIPSMRFSELATLGAVISGIGYPIRPSTDSGTIRIHLLGHAIGSERYLTRSDGDALVLTDTFAFTDRGGRVQLVSELRYGRSFEPLHLRSVGRTYRFVNVDADMDVPKGVFAVASYAPLEVQALLVRYWETHGRPKTIAIAPGDSTARVTIEFLGE